MTSSSSAQAWAGRRSRPGLRRPARRILILERGERLQDSDGSARRARDLPARRFRPQEILARRRRAGRSIRATTTTSAATRNSTARCCIRYRAQDFEPIAHRGGTTPGWPFAYDELEPWYTRAEKLYRVRGALGVRPHRAAALGALSVWPRAGRAGDRKGARASEARGPATRFRCRSASTSTDG